jgi:chemosensory pili system protein ChpA (sensor histidine kinase/response regulator)
MTDLPQAQHNFFPHFDSAPLACVREQVAVALQRSISALSDAVAPVPGGRAQALQDAALHLQQAGSALQTANVEGAALLTQAAQLALRRFADGALACSAEHAQTVSDLVHALSDYLDQVLSGAPAQPVRLFPYYRALQAMLGSARIHPADLFFPDLTLKVVIAPADRLIATDYPVWRQRFEQSLLPFLTDGALAAQHAGVLRDVVAQVLVRFARLCRTGCRRPAGWQPVRETIVRLDQFADAAPKPGRLRLARVHAARRAVFHRGP